MINNNVDIKNLLSKKQKSLFGIEPNRKSVLLNKIQVNIDNSLRKRDWTPADAGEAYIFLLLYAMLNENKRNEVFKKNIEVSKKSTQMLHSSTDLKHYNAYVDLFNWLKLAATTANLYKSRATHKLILQYQIIRTLIYCEDINFNLNLKDKAKYLYKISLDQFIVDRDENWKDNIEKFKTMTLGIKEAIKNLLYYNRSLEAISKCINMEELSLIQEDLEFIKKIKSLHDSVLSLKMEIDADKFKYLDKEEKKLRSETTNKLLQILEYDDLIIWEKNNFDNSDNIYPIFRDGLNIAITIQEINNAKKN
jgi:hypothetical protein